SPSSHASNALRTPSPQPGGIAASRPASGSSPPPSSPPPSSPPPSSPPPSRRKPPSSRTIGASSSPPQPATTAPEIATNAIAETHRATRTGLIAGEHTGGAARPTVVI